MTFCMVKYFLGPSYSHAATYFDQTCLSPENFTVLELKIKLKKLKKTNHSVLSVTDNQEPNNPNQDLSTHLKYEFLLRACLDLVCLLLFSPNFIQSEKPMGT